ncbi:MAG TPA: histidine kinase [Ideonella sp.]|nr:histidine kinase [Ideonella sp.]
MSSSASTPDTLIAPTIDKGPSAEMRRFSAGMRAITALLCTMLLFTREQQTGFWGTGVLLAYCLWSCWLLWREASGRIQRAALWVYWIDVAWSCLSMKLLSTGTMLLVLTLVNPVVLTSIGYGVTQGLLLALAASAGLLLDSGSERMFGIGVGGLQGLPLLVVLAVIPATAVFARPMSALRRRQVLIDELETQLDPRRGLDPICAELVERLRNSTQAEVVALVLPSGLGAPAMIASREDGSFRAKIEVHMRLEALLSHAPPCPVSHVIRRWWDLRPRTRLHADLPMPDGLSGPLAELAHVLDVRCLHVVPLTRYARQHGHLVAGYAGARGAPYTVCALASAAPELLRVVEQATLVDQLQEESSAHERARIGRDLHDSAIQPYLGLKYAVECVALRIPPDNPARAEVDSLAELVNGEVAALRELISGLRTGNDRGDNALVPAVRRQVRRFAVLFGIDVEIDCPDSLPTTRALASSLFHMINEVLNNIRKHTTARRVWISLSVELDTVRLVVRDNAGSMRGRQGEAFHPRSLSERAEELGGSLQISHPDGLNTELAIQIPL